VTNLLRLSLPALAIAAMATGSLHAQQMQPTNGRQFPLNQYSPPGMVAEWARQAGKIHPHYFQPVKLFLPSDGRVTFYDHRPDRPVELEAPAQAALLVGRLYRFKIDNMPEFPGVEFYPSLELIDRLHPPVDKVDQFPIEFEISQEEFEFVIAGRLITKVIYLEQPQRVPRTHLEQPRKTTTVPAAQNALAEADDRGRPMAIIRLGGRTPDVNGMDPQFFGPGGPVQLSARPETVGVTSSARVSAQQANLQATAERNRQTMLKSSTVSLGTRTNP